ncbi:restriction endonuclease [Micromonospora sp. NPDC047527]|uniref:restriction endonuclease n=1 Tax=Micromonospora sp. NPDC047527 TaxID=3155144 RepID=UPI0033E9B7A9
MTESTEDTPGSWSESPLIDDIADPLDRWARATAVLLGAATEGAGCVAVFTVDNQAGTAVLLLVGAVLLLLGLQGTPLRSLGGGDYRVELTRLRRRAVAVVDQAARQESAEVAAAVADAVSAIDPGVRFPFWPAMRYEQQVREAIQAAGASLGSTRLSAHRDQGVDLCVQVPEGRVNVQVIYRRHGKIGSREVTLAVVKMRNSGVDGGYLIVTNAATTADAQTRASLLGGADKVEIVTWTDDEDTEELNAALRRGAR